MYFPGFSKKIFWSKIFKCHGMFFLPLQVFYYSTNLFRTTGLSETNAKYATIGIGLVMVIMTLISIPLMDRSGRRTLHLYGLGGMFIFSIFITISFLVKVSLLHQQAPQISYKSLTLNRNLWPGYGGCQWSQPSFTLSSLPWAQAQYHG